jgi:hypothetical protein
VAKGNHHDDESWCAARQNLLVSLRFAYGMTFGSNKMSKLVRLHESARILIAHASNSSIVDYCLVRSVKEHEIEVTVLSFSECSTLHNSPIFSSAILGETKTVPKSLYRGHFDVTCNNYVNMFLELNMIKK